jgi:hypothetical protein
LGQHGFRKTANGSEESDRREFERSKGADGSAGPLRKAAGLPPRPSKRGEWNETDEQGSITFGEGRAEVSCLPDALLLEVDAPEEALPRLEDVVGRHLVRFGTRDELVVRWTRQGGRPGSEQRLTDG